MGLSSKILFRNTSSSTPAPAPDPPSLSFSRNGVPDRVHGDLYTGAPLDAAGRQRAPESPEALSTSPAKVLPQVHRQVAPGVLLYRFLGSACFNFVVLSQSLGGFSGAKMAQFAE